MTNQQRKKKGIKGTKCQEKKSVTASDETGWIAAVLGLLVSTGKNVQDRSLKKKSFLIKKIK